MIFSTKQLGPDQRTGVSMHDAPHVPAEGSYSLLSKNLQRTPPFKEFANSHAHLPGFSIA
jgi:hypothetical protein